MDYPDPLIRNMEVDGKYKLPTIDMPEDMNAIYDEIKAVIIAGGLTPDRSDFTQMRDSINAMLEPILANIGVSIVDAPDSTVTFDTNAGVIVFTGINDIDFICPAGDYTKCDINFAFSLDSAVDFELMLAVIGSTAEYYQDFAAGQEAQSHANFVLIGVPITPGQSLRFFLRIAGAGTANISTGSNNSHSQRHLHVRFYS